MKPSALTPVDAQAMLLQQLARQQSTRLGTKAVSSGHRCVDDPDLVEVDHVRGKLIQRFGFSRGCRTYLRLEEAVYVSIFGPAHLVAASGRRVDCLTTRRWLADQRQLVLTDDTNSTAHPNGYAALLTSMLRGSYRIEVYSTFAMLSELGYIVRTRRPPPPTYQTHGTTSSDPESRPSKRQCLPAATEACTNAGPVAGEGNEAQVSGFVAGGHHPTLGPNCVHLDVFAPNKSFRRSEPGPPHYVVSVCEVDCPPPSTKQLRQLVAAEEGSTLLHAIASGAEVQLLSLAPRSTNEFDLGHSSGTESPA